MCVCARARACVHVYLLVHVHAEEGPEPQRMSCDDDSRVACIAQAISEHILELLENTFWGL